MRTIVEISVYERILEFYAGVAIAHPNTFDSLDVVLRSTMVYEDLVDMCSRFTLPRPPRIKSWREAGYLELFSKSTGWCFGYTLDIIEGETARHIRICEKSENIH